MKRIFLTIALAALASGPAHADSSRDALVDALCGLEGEVAIKIMRSRQNGVGMAEIMALLDKSQISSKPDRDRFLAMVVNAYSQPMFSTPENKARAAGEFGNAATVACYKSRA